MTITSSTNTTSNVNSYLLVFTEDDCHTKFYII